MLQPATRWHRRSGPGANYLFSSHQVRLFGVEVFLSNFFGFVCDFFRVMFGCFFPRGVDTRTRMLFFISMFVAF